MGLLQKILIPVLGLVLAFCFYSSRENFKPEMLKGKRVIVTGASTGIGEQMAYHLARMGAHVLVTARTEAKLQQVVERCRALGASSARLVSGSMEDMATTRQLVEVAEAELGGLDMLILNHVGKSYFNYFDGDVGHVQKLLNINFLSYVAMTVSALPMLKRSGGSIVVVSSMAENAMRAAADVLLMSPAPKEECALEIIKGGTLRQREVYYRYASTKLPLLLRDWAAELLDLLVRQRYRPERLRAA
ncbi:11-beta-hydroxysteroid dehydrogenase 1-like isoform X2 [Tympanuchus pallidicinctus]|uniref:11-beta-hydroxysteroid dehydrogenase 1-like isoform X2 n=1 Tax=Tympanuchus pallidicinctus TaxID=109042 RepID=UPI0022870C3E|nr:11-beta-hydroxysteroid dehydrogenase 1-like isoform X2 [Tympanuchus pallidicinctus]